MASVSAIRGATPSQPRISVSIHGLDRPAREYSKFRHQIFDNGVFKHERNWTYNGNTGDAYFYDDTDLSWWADNGTHNVTIRAWATYNGQEYYIGESVVQ